MQLTQKETELLKDLKEEETLCVDKYSRHASCAKDTQLQSLFRQIAENEQHHLDTIVKMQQGEVPKMSSGSSSSQPTFSPTYRTADSEDKKAIAISATMCFPQKSMPPICMTPAFLNSRTKMQEMC